MDHLAALKSRLGHDDDDYHYYYSRYVEDRSGPVASAILEPADPHSATRSHMQALPWMSIHVAPDLLSSADAVPTCSRADG